MAKDIRVALELDNRQFSRNIKTSEKQVDQLKGGLGGLRTVLAGVFAVMSGRQLADFSDGITTLQTKLRSFIPDLDDAEAAFKAVSAISILTGQNVESVGDLFTKLGRNAGNMGLSLRDVGDFTQQLTTAFALFGATSRETETAIYNIGQAFSLTKFQGEDLNSVIETMGPVAQKMAEVVGVKTVGELKTLASQGKVTADVIVEALDRMDKEGILRLERRVPTLGEAFNSLRTSFALLFSEIDEESGKVSSNFASAIEYMAFQVYRLSKSAETIIGPLTKFFKILGAIAAFTIIGKIIRGIGATFTAITTTAAEAGTAMSGLIRTFSIIGGYIKRFFGKEVANPKNTIFEGLRKSVGYLKGELTGLFTFIGGIGAGVAAFLGIDKLIEDFKSLGEEGSKASEDMKAFKEELEGFKEALPDEPIGEKLSVTIPKTDLQKFTEELNKMKPAVDTFEDGLKKLNDTLGKPETVKQIQDYESALSSLKDAFGVNDEFDEFKESFEDIDSIEEYNTALTTLQGLLNAGKISAQEFADAKEDLDERLGDNQSLLDFIATLNTATDTLADDLAVSLMEGKSALDDFKNFFKTLVQQIIADAIKMLFIIPILQAIGFSVGPTGSIAGFSGKGLLGNLGVKATGAGGGAVMANRPMLIGEQGMEIFTPSSSGTITPNHQMGTNVYYTINATDPASFQAQLSRDPQFVHAIVQKGQNSMPSGRRF
jgi:tape measure domain-containing protein